MMTSIIKSPLSIPARVRLGSVADGEAGNSARGDSTPAHAELEARLHAHYAQKYKEELSRAIGQAREEADRKGYVEGLEKGRAEGLAAGREAWREQIERLETMLAQAERSLQAMREDTRRSAEALTLESVCRLLGEHAIEPRAIVGMVRQITDRLHDADVLQVRLHPAEHESLRKALAAEDHALRLRCGRLVERLTADMSLESGGCVVETTRGEYVGTFDVQLQRLKQMLQRRRPEPGKLSEHAGVACA